MKTIISAENCVSKWYKYEKQIKAVKQTLLIQNYIRLAAFAGKLFVLIRTKYYIIDFYNLRI